MRSNTDIIAEAKANNQELLYRCRWCAADADRVVPDLIQVLYDINPAMADEALRSLFTIGTPAVAAAPCVAQLIGSEHRITRQLAAVTLGTIAQKEPSLCIGPITRALDHEECVHEALRFLKFMGGAAKDSLPQVAPFCDSPHAKTRKLAILAIMSIAGESHWAQRIVEKALTDPSKVVRLAVEKAARSSSVKNDPAGR